MSDFTLSGVKVSLAWHPTLTDFRVASIEGPPASLADFAKPARVGYAMGCYGWAMLPADHRAKYATPEEFIAALTPAELTEFCRAVVDAVTDGIESAQAFEKGAKSPKKATRG